MDTESQAFSVLDAISSTPGFHHGYYRILIQPSTIKYLAWDETIPATPDFRGRRLDFTVVPRGDWNIGYLKGRDDTDKLNLERTEKRTLAGARMWHPGRIEWLELGRVTSGSDEPQCKGKMFGSVREGLFGREKVICSVEWYPDWIYGVSNETAVYEAIDGHSIGPAFLGHVTENEDRVIGYIAERVVGHPAGEEDVEACRGVLTRLHGLGFAYGGFHPGCFIRTGSGVVLHSFGGSYRTDDTDTLEQEMNALPDWLAENS